MAKASNQHISATIVARNEETKIGACLQSIRKVADEIIFVHDGNCEDSTLKIAGKYGCKIFVRPYVGEAEPHRRFAIAKASNNWILQIDADEFLTTPLASRIPALVADSSVSGYRFRWNVSYTDEKPRYNPKLILYRKDKIRLFYGIPHEVVSLSGKIVTIDSLELGHNRTRSAQKTHHNTKQWPRIHGKYMEKYKFRNIPFFLLPFGYLFYPLLSTIVSLIRGTTYIKDAPGCFDYHFRLWHSFFTARLARLADKQGTKNQPEQKKRLGTKGVKKTSGPQTAQRRRHK